MEVMFILLTHIGLQSINRVVIIIKAIITISGKLQL